MSWNPHRPDRWEMSVVMWLLGFVAGFVAGVAATILVQLVMA